ncbi:Mg2+ transporter protein CorA-like/Zinc transport protein ZntB [Lasiodiplodia theobromae]|uniref:Pre-rRNA-processing protein n=1 Tax=Lasiodiplodia theobromae TaxID=45133 RepID=A0A5N5DN05_9PEZI|nr:Mg2+ transporter protein CorA-like/Zinc transport protein ZntB [Lasiodiplodia theobromae]KAB2579117.1 Pre-rRNA-processing protein ipi1 [Lasiodiplodia theobromae]KAF4537415.1 Mg2+ transporter protein CorA-like/Zinc transport protein ZntB [Lasiodiplodia theobromae]KAF9639614.1 Mg2+ transporter protein CorA-like/Zinc transport protein ZntB [Lasiodiplodia theobromae]
MGSSAKRKKEKKKDFQKPKLKVGKTKPKADNFTDTSFKAKSIIVKEQSIHTNAPTVTVQFTHQLGLLTHKSDTQRRESLSYLTNSVTAARSQDVPLPQPVSVIVPKILSLIYDNSNGVRQQLLKLLQALPPADLRPHVEELLRRTRAGMTSLSTDVCTTSFDVLDWLLQTHPDATVSCAGGWVHTLRCFTSVLGWRDPGAAGGQKWTTTAAANTSSSSHANAEKLKKLRYRQLVALAAFLKAGIAADAEAARAAREEEEARVARAWFPLHHHAQCHMLLNQSPNGFAHLNLFGAPKDEDGQMYTDRQGRQQVFARLIQPAIVSGLQNAKKEGGQIGRAAGEVEKVMQESMSDYDGGEL